MDTDPTNPQPGDEGRPGLRAGVDVGGTFTDLLLADDATGAFTIVKTLTTPHDPSLAIEAALREAARQSGHDVSSIGAIVHGTTLVTNALIERKGDPTALLATRGFRDSVEIGRESRYDLYDLFLELPRPLVPRYLRFDVPERTLADGTMLQPVDEPFVERLARELAENGIVAVAVAFLNSFANPANERRAREAIHRAVPRMRVSLSSEVSPTIREFERTSTTMANVYVQARVERYLLDLQARLEALDFGGAFHMMLSSGGVATASTAIAFPIRLLESGPAGGALAAAELGVAAGYADHVSFDMGGTTAKFCVIEEGVPLLAQEFEFDRVFRFRKGSGLPATIPVIDMVEIGAGGGSIARVNALGLLKVGPDSAGADPGPACYGRGGTEPTVTDADLVLGYLDPGFFLGGRMRLDLAAARRAIEDRIARRLGLSIEEAAWGIHQVVNETMATAARAHILERGKDPAALPVFVFGGAGPVHGSRIARALGSPRVLVPFGAGIASTLGFLAAPIAFDFVKPWRVALEGLDWRRADEHLAGMEREGAALLLASGVDAAEMTAVHSVDLRFVGQGHEITVPLAAAGDEASARTAAVTAAFEAAYRKLYGRAGPPVPLEAIQWRVVVSGPKPVLRLRVAGPSGAMAVKGTRRAWFPELGGYAAVPVLDRYGLPRGYAQKGPAIVEERESTTVVGPGMRCLVDAEWNLVLEPA